MGSTPIFVDSAGFFALQVRQDPARPTALSEMQRRASGESLWVTSDYILEEAATLLRARGHYDKALGLLELATASDMFRVEWITPERFERARGIFERYRDQDYSFTDCVSFALMQELRISSALTTDAHFDRMGFQRLLG